MQRGKRGAVGNFRPDLVGDPHRLGQFAPAMHDPVTHGCQLCRVKPVVGQRCEDRGECFGVGGELAVAAGVCDAQARLRRADPLGQTGEPLIEVGVEDREFDRGGACVEDQNIGGGSGAHSATFAILRAARPAISVTT